MRLTISSSSALQSTLLPDAMMLKTKSENESPKVGSAMAVKRKMAALKRNAIKAAANKMMKLKTVTAKLSDERAPKSLSDW